MKGNHHDRTRTERIPRPGMELCSIHSGGGHLFPLRSHRNSGHASSPDTRSFRSFVHSPSLPRTSGSSFLKNSSRLHGGVHAGGISLRINGRICYDTNRSCCITAKYRITLLYGAGYWQVIVISAQILIRMTSLCATGSGSSSTTHGFGLTAPVRRSSQNRCGGASCTALPTCCQTAPTLTSSAMRIGAVLTSFRN